MTERRVSIVPSSLRLMALAAAVPGCLVATAGAAVAHPHVWVTVETTVNYDKGTVVGLTHKWTFDEMYTAMAIQGLDTDNDGNYDRKELSELAQINIDGLKEFDFFTFAKLGDATQQFTTPQDYWLEYASGQLSLHLTTPLAKPVLAEAEGLSFAVYDPSYFIAFEMAKSNPVRVSEGAPTGCTATLEVPPQDAELAKKLGDALQVGPTGSVGMDLGAAVTKSINVSCPKS